MASNGAAAHTPTAETADNFDTLDAFNRAQQAVNQGEMKRNKSQEMKAVHLTKSASIKLDLLDTKEDRKKAKNLKKAHSKRGSVDLLSGLQHAAGQQDGLTLVKNFLKDVLCGCFKKDEDDDEVEEKNVDDEEAALKALEDDMMNVDFSINEQHDFIGFSLPPLEKSILHKMSQELAQNKKWQRFDGFFGLFLLANSISIGVQLEFPEPKSMWTAIDLFFLIVFISELAFRCILLGPYWFYYLPRDSWATFDAIIIIVSILETFVFTASNLPFPVGVLRLFRLLKLAKMVRLVRAFRSLGMLVEGIIGALKTLVWTALLMILVVYIGGVMMVKLARWTKTQEISTEAARTLEPWATVYDAMWFLLRQATYDRWASLARGAAFGADLGVGGAMLAIVQILVICVSALGIMNLVVGVLCHTAFDLDVNAKRMKGAETLLEQQRTLVRYRRLLKSYGDRPLFKTDVFIEDIEVFQSIEDSPAIQECLSILCLTRKDMCDLVNAFEEDGMVEIDGMIEAVAIIVLQRYFGKTAVDFSGESAMGAVRPADMLFFSHGLKTLEEAVSLAEVHSESAAIYIFDAVRVLEDLAHSHKTLFASKGIGDKSEPEIEEEHHAPEVTNDFEYLDLYQDQVRMATINAQLTMPMDAIFGLCIVLNGGFIGVQNSVQDENAKMPLYIIDNCFVLIFVVEFILRAMLNATLEECKDFNNKIGAGGSKSKVLEDVHSKLLCGLFPRCPKGGFGSTCKHLPHMFKDLGNVFDALVILSSIVDTWILAPLRETGAVDVDLAFLGVLRVFKLVRLVKLLRVFKLFPQLQLIVEAIAATLPTIIWTSVLQFLAIYVMSIFAVLTVSQGDLAKDDTTATFYYFGSISRCMITGWQLSTFNNWGAIWDAGTQEVPWFGMIVIGFMVFIGLGIMNISVGVLCESAVNLMQLEREEAHRGGMLTFMSAMEDFRSAIHKYTKDGVITPDVLRDALFSNADDHLQETPGKRKSVLSVVGKQQIRHALEKAKMKPLMVRQVFDKLDYENTQRMDLDTFIQGCIEMKEDMAKLDVFASGLSLKIARELRTEVCHKLQQLHDKIEVVVRKMDTVVNRLTWSGKIQATPRSGRGDGLTTVPETGAHGGGHGELQLDGSTKLHLDALDGETKDAIERLATPRPVVEKGVLLLFPGTGQVSAGGDQVFGKDTFFKKEVNVGDMILIEREITDPVTRKSDTIVEGLVVKTVVNNTSIKLGAKCSGCGWQEFRISRPMSPEGQEGKQLNETPRCVRKDVGANQKASQQFFEWECRSQRHQQDTIWHLEMTNGHLKQEVQNLQGELDKLQETKLLTKGFHSWCMAMDEE